MAEDRVDRNLLSLEAMQRGFLLLLLLPLGLLGQELLYMREESSTADVCISRLVFLVGLRNIASVAPSEPWRVLSS